MRSDLSRNPPGNAYAGYVVAVLTLAYLFSFMDRQIMSLLIEPIRSDLAISDTQVSLLGGLAFALCHSIAALPFGRLADIWSRRGVIIVCITSWCGLTAACGLAQNFWQMFFTRMGVGIGEAGLSPSAYSMIQDYFPSQQFAAAMGWFVMGAPLGAGCALLVGGAVSAALEGMPAVVLPLVGELAPWQMIFIIVGLLGLGVAVLMLTVKEPVRRGLLKGRGGTAPAPTLPVARVAGFIRLNSPLFVPYLAGLSLLNIFNYGCLAWSPTLFVREHGWTIAQAGARVGIVLLTFGILAPVCAGRFVRALERRGRGDAALYAVIVGAVVLLPLATAAPLVSSPWLSLALYGPVFFLIFFIAGVVPTSILVITPNQMRAQVSAFYLLIVNLAGVGLGPTVFALFTDFVFRRDSALALSLAVVPVLAVGAGLLLLTISRPAYRQSLERARAWREPEGATHV